MEARPDELFSFPFNTENFQKAKVPLQSYHFQIGPGFNSSCMKPLLESVGVNDKSTLREISKFNGQVWFYMFFTCNL